MTARLWLSRGLALLALGICIWVAIVFGRYALGTSDSWREVFPFPALYLLEITAVGVLGVMAAIMTTEKATRLLWVLCGILAAFVILAGFSIGRALTPALVCLLGVAGIASLDHSYPLLRGLAWLAGAAALQATIMILFTRF